MRETPRVPIKNGAISKHHSRLPLILIGVGKLFKALCLVGVSFVASYLLKPQDHQALRDTLDQWRLDPGSHHLHWLLEKMLAIDPKQLHLLHVGALIYAGLFAIEGIGLLLDKAWAEWMLVLTTGLLLPVEAWELLERRTWPPMVIFILNIIVLIYVCFRLKWRIQDNRLKQSQVPESVSSPKG